ncbi:MAG: hypothetical protein IV112_07545 [Methyloversatilis discipulorum]|uniref:hypothetical protein n=1 Tax=Methyloversatilis discipulorum TaxID=1119528 RepID=UPI0026EEE708|nr:hypothetical protein [Methyloversatilis discipulorum]MBT9516530.1 hypothetical protein [Methyloversatilis discipulorum]
MTLEKAAQALETDEREVLALVAENRLRCGVFSKWYGQAMPERGGRWKGHVSEYHPNGSRESKFHYTNELTGRQFCVRGGRTAQFWFLEHHDAYLIATSPDGAVEVGFLVPEDGAKLHEQNPERFPTPEFVLWLETEEGAQDSPRRITLNDLWFRRIDIEALKQQEAENDRDATTSTGDRWFMSKDLVLLNQASRKWWANADRDDGTTHPRNSEVEEWLKSEGMAESKATSAASIIRPEWAVKGRRAD